MLIFDPSLERVNSPYSVHSAHSLPPPLYTLIHGSHPHAREDDSYSELNYFKRVDSLYLSALLSTSQREQVSFPPSSFPKSPSMSSRCYHAHYHLVSRLLFRMASVLFSCTPEHQSTQCPTPAPAFAWQQSPPSPNFSGTRRRCKSTFPSSQTTSRA